MPDDARGELEQLLAENDTRVSGGGMMTREALIEQLADIEHQRWSDWQEYVHEGCAHDEYDRPIIDPENYNRWQRQIATPYADLSEQEKQSDREQVARYLPLIVAFVETWIDQNCSHMIASEAAEKWREEMGDAL